MRNGKLRHKVAIQRPLRTQNQSTGAITVTWQDFYTGVYAEIAPLSARDFIAAQASQSEIIARIVMKYRPGIEADMRIVHGAHVYNIVGALPDAKSGIEYLSIPVTRGVNQG